MNERVLAHAWNSWSGDRNGQKLGKKLEKFLSTLFPIKKKWITTCQHCYLETQLRAKMLRWIVAGWCSDFIPITLTLATIPSKRCHFWNDWIFKSGSLMLLCIDSISQPFQTYTGYINLHFKVLSPFFSVEIFIYLFIQCFTHLFYLLLRDILVTVGIEIAFS